MIQNVTFMGREECLSKPAKQAASKFHQYLSPCAIIEEKMGAQINTVKESANTAAVNYFSECIPEGKAVADTSADKIAEAYRAAHGIKY